MDRFEADGSQTTEQQPFTQNVSSTSPQQAQASMAQQPPGTQTLDGQTSANGQEEVMAVRKNGDGDIVELQLSSGKVVDYKTAQTMVKNKEIRNLNVFRGRDNEEHLRSNADGDPSNNLDNLPTF